MMKKLISGAVFASVVFPALSAPVVNMPERKSFADTIASWFDGVWYGEIRGEMSYLHWKNKYSASDATVDGQSDSFAMEPVLGGALAFGHIFDEHWRGAVEAGMIGRFVDSGYGVDFTMTIPYLSVNALYDFDTGVYVGGGLGLALPKIDFDFDTINIEKRGVSPIFALMAGYSYHLSEVVSLDLRYRLSAVFGPDAKESGINGLPENYFELDTGFILNNSISIALRYEF